MKTKYYLMDVVFIRLMLIIFLILYHSLCIYTGSWRHPYEPFPEIDIYNWLGMLTHSFRLEGMVFISGLLFGYKLKRNPESLNFYSCVVRKAKRILLPSIIFGIVYYLLFYDLSASPWLIIYKILDGCGHLWFLPMIFWCFLLTYLLTHISYHPNLAYKILLILLLISIVNPFSFLPFGLGETGHYFLYFYIGFSLKIGLVQIPTFDNKRIVFIAAIFAFSFVTYMFVRDCLISADNFYFKFLRRLILGSLNAISALSAIYVMYGATNKAKVISFLKKKPVLITWSGYCYGVYIYQQFILQILYYDTDFPVLFGVYWLPWIAFCITLVLSLSLCYITLRFKWGRFLIG